MILLSQVLGTKYLVRDYCEDLNHMIRSIESGTVQSPEMMDNELLMYAINESIGASVVDIDIADCHFVPDTWEVLRLLLVRPNTRFVLRDTKDADRNRYLRGCYSTKKSLTMYDSMTKPFPTVRNSTDFIQACNTIMKAPEYIYEIVGSERAEILTASIIALERPEWKVTFTSYRSLFESVHRDLMELMLEFPFEDYLYLDGPGSGTYVETHFENDVGYVLGIGDVTREWFLHHRVCVPAKFGRESGLFTNHDKESEMWNKVLEGYYRELHTLSTVTTHTVMGLFGGKNINE